MELAAGTQPTKLGVQGWGVGGRAQTQEGVLQGGEIWDGSVRRPGSSPCRLICDLTWAVTGGTLEGGLVGSPRHYAEGGLGRGGGAAVMQLHPGRQLTPGKLGSRGGPSGMPLSGTGAGLSTSTWTCHCLGATCRRQGPPESRSW